MRLNRWQNFFLKFVQYIFLEFVFVSLDKSVLLHRRCLVSKVSEILNWCADKIFLFFIQFYTKLFPIAMVSLLYKNLILSILTYYFMIESIFVQSWLIWATFHFVSSKVPFAKIWCGECSYKTFSKNAEAAVRKCSSEKVAQRSSVKKETSKKQKISKRKLQ